MVDYADLTGDKTVRRALPDLTTELKEQPELILNCLGVAIHQVQAQSCCYLYVVMWRLPLFIMYTFHECL